MPTNEEEGTSASDSSNTNEIPLDSRDDSGDKFGTQQFEELRVHYITLFQCIMVKGRNNKNYQIPTVKMTEMNVLLSRLVENPECQWSGEVANDTMTVMNE